MKKQTLILCLVSAAVVASSLACTVKQSVAGSGDVTRVGG